MRPATPSFMKQVNDSLLRKALRELGRATQAELAGDTGLSLTTVAQGLRALEEGLEIRKSGCRESRGGRRAALYERNPDAAHFYSVAVEGDRLSWAVANALGTVLSEGTRMVHRDAIEETVDLMKDMREDAFSSTAPRAAAAVGIPGALLEGRVLTGKFSRAWRDADLGASLSERTGIRTVLENDVNAAALGFERRSRLEGRPLPSLVYLYRNDDGTGAGVVADGRLVRGAACFAGEVGHMPLYPDKTFDQALTEAGTDSEYAEAWARALAAVNCVVNPALCVVGGSHFRFDLSDAIEREYNARIDATVRPRLVFNKNTRIHYLAGLCAVAEETLFPSYRLSGGREP